MGEGAATIVIVDDAPEVRLLVKTRLRMSGRLRVVGEAGDGVEAVALAREHEPSLMLLDVSLPGMDGFETLPRVHEVSPGTRVVLFSGFEEHGLAEKAAQLGAAAFIEKSTPVDALVKSLSTLAGPTRQLQTQRTSSRPAPAPRRLPRRTSGCWTSISRGSGRCSRRPPSGWPR